jgi:predicted nuclease of predicted toxin-antitoxin system
VKGFLLNENLPSKLTFHPSLPIIHARHLGSSLSDLELWEYCHHHDLVIITKDADFSDRILVADPPPKVVHLKFGNMKLKDFHAHLEKVWPQVEAALTTSKLINVYLTYLEEIA